MPFLEDVSLGASSGKTPEEKLEALVQQINSAFRAISNEKKTLVIKGSQTTDAISIGDLGNQRYGILLNDGTNDRMVIGRVTDGF